MSDRARERRQRRPPGTEPAIAPPSATGGGGDQFEKLVGASYLADLLLQRSTRGIDGTVVNVSFQSRHLGHLYDDIVVATAVGVETRVLEIQVKRGIRFTAADSPTIDVLGEGLRAIAREESAFVAGRRRLAIALPSDISPAAAREMHELSEQARASTAPEAFYDHMTTPVIANQALRRRLSHLLDAKATATDVARQDNDPELWRWLDALMVLPFELSGPAARDRVSVVNALAALYEPADAERAQVLFEALRTRTADLAPLAGSVNKQRLVWSLPAALSFVTDSARPTVDRWAQSDALLRGPVSALGMQGDLRQAENLREVDPGRAAVSFGLVAGALESNGYVGHAILLRRREAAALRLAGLFDRAVNVLLPLAWEYIDQGEADEAFTLVTDLLELVAEIDPEGELARSAAAISAAHDLLNDPFPDIESLAATVASTGDESSEHRDRLAARLTRFFVEYAVVNEQFDFVLDRAELLTDMAASIEDEDQETAVRLLVCLADVTGDWFALRRRASRDFDPRWRALIAGRYARARAWAAQPDDAIDAWRDAVERGCLTGVVVDVGEWLYAQRDLHMRYGPNLGDPNEFHHLAQALRLTGDRRLLPGGRARERALERLQTQRLPGAADALRRYLAESTISAHWSSELDAHRLLGQLFALTGDSSEAARHFIRSGASEPMKELLARIGDQYIDVSAELLRAAPWERAMTYTAIALQADLVPDGQVEVLLTQALADAQASADRSIRQSSFFGPSVYLATFTTIGALAERCPSNLVQEILDLLQPLAQRDPGTYRRTDDAHARALLGLLRSQPGWAEELVQRLLEALAADQRMAEVFLREGNDVLESHRVLMLPGLRAIASAGNRQAAVALTLLEDDSPQQQERARNALDRVIHARGYEPGKAVGLSLVPDSLLIRILGAPDRMQAAEHLAAMASDRAEHAGNREEALRALFNLARYIDDQLRDALYPQAMSFARREQEGSAFDDLLMNSHPLSRVRINLGGDLAPAGLGLAAALAHDQVQYREVRDQGLKLLRAAEQPAIGKLAHALYALPEGVLGRDARLLTDRFALLPQQSGRAIPRETLVWVSNSLKILSPASERPLGTALGRSRRRRQRWPPTWLRCLPAIPAIQCGAGS